MVKRVATVKSPLNLEIYYRLELARKQSELRKWEAELDALNLKNIKQADYIERGQAYLDNWRIAQIAAIKKSHALKVEKLNKDFSEDWKNKKKFLEEEFEKDLALAKKVGKSESEQKTLKKLQLEKLNIAHENLRAPYKKAFMDNKDLKDLRLRKIKNIALNSALDRDKLKLQKQQIKLTNKVETCTAAIGKMPLDSRWPNAILDHLLFTKNNWPQVYTDLHKNTRAQTAWLDVLQEQLHDYAMQAQTKGYPERCKALGTIGALMTKADNDEQSKAILSKVGVKPAWDALRATVETEKLQLKEIPVELRHPEVAALNVKAPVESYSLPPRSVDQVLAPKVKVPYVGRIPIIGFMVNLGARLVTHIYNWRKKEKVKKFIAETNQQWQPAPFTESTTTIMGELAPTVPPPVKLATETSVLKPFTNQTPPQEDMSHKIEYIRPSDYLADHIEYVYGPVAKTISPSSSDESQPKIEESYQPNFDWETEKEETDVQPKTFLVNGKIHHRSEPIKIPGEISAQLCRVKQLQTDTPKNLAATESDDVLGEWIEDIKAHAESPRP